MLFEDRRKKVVSIERISARRSIVDLADWRSRVSGDGGKAG
jgi:hypothetical protein